MKWFYDMKIGKKLTSSFIMVALLAGIVGAIGITNLKSMDNRYNELYEQFGQSVGELGNIGMNFQNIRALVRDVLLHTDTAKQSEAIEQINSLMKETDSLIATFKQSLQNEDEKARFNELADGLGEYRQYQNRIIAFASSQQTEQGMKELEAGAAISKKVDGLIDDLYHDKNTEGARRSTVYTASSKTIIATMLAIVIIAMLTAVALGLLISRIISKPISKLVESAERIANGDLNMTVDVATKDEVGVLAAAFGKMTDNMNEVLSNIQNASEQVSTGARQVSESSIVLSQGASEQASSVEQLTASLEQIAAQTRLNAENAVQANMLADQARINAQQGNDRMKEMLNAMEEINTSSGSISKIIKVIDEIAFQTNILALNAAVEAARAGQHGRGFAVVAEEVRNLAARSANAAKETTDMIEGSIRKVEDGTKIANETASALNQIVDGVAKVANLVNSISEASTEQATGVEQINQGIMQVSQVVQTNSATSEESAAASEELTGQAEMLKQQISRFILRKTQPSATYKEYEQLDPEMLRMLENMAGKAKKRNWVIESDQPEVAAAKSSTILLSDREFGKY
ncbi:methyl-accepting chemotaxis protein [Bacillus sp. FJAT-26390]|uniref:methyl-accepting chemotaxis protein n=1 Tax=Bacillus sp. FJAT-26390 TaxID=1743142 RepID=UPI000807F197|nr:methyl-accepting chemotaxis protein [Bacillus sp. FJAT-26390]OBZ07804.1 chemotaxis protein [Bacillus sp. FJAT-26390]